MASHLLQNLRCLVESRGKTIVICVVVLFGLARWRRVKQRLRKTRGRSRPTPGRDVVVVHTLPRGKFCPSLSPASLKVETFLRMCDVKYEVATRRPVGPKGQLPWVTFNGETMSDTEVIDYVQDLFAIDFDLELTKEERAVAKAFTIMADHHLSWCVYAWHFVHSGGIHLPLVVHLPLPMVLLQPLWPIAFRGATRRVWAQGMGRHTDKEVEDIVRRDLRTISIFLGTKRYLMGDTPHPVDCALFGVVGQIKWNMPGSPYSRMLDLEFPSLHRYCQHVKETFWPDWNRNIRL